MGLKSLINFLILNSSILYFTIHRNNEQASETCLKILLYSYFFRSLWNLRYQNFLHKLFNHEFEIFSCSNVLICFSIFHFSYSSKLQILRFLAISILNISINFCILFLCFQNSFLMYSSKIYSFFIFYFLLVWRRLLRNMIKFFWNEVFIKNVKYFKLFLIYQIVCFLNFNLH